MNLCLSKVGQRKLPSGWTSFNAVCCVHNGETVDNRKRGGLILTEEGGVRYSCFNCQYKTGWSPGFQLSKKMSNLLEWFGIDNDEIKKINYRAMWLKNNIDKPNQISRAWLVLDFPEKSLPVGAKSFSYWAEQKEHDPKFLSVIQYVAGRGDHLLTATDYYWTPKKHDKTNLANYVIIPFKWKGKNVGWTARATFPTKYRYFSNVPSNYLFNTECIKQEHEFIIVVEGPFDAVSIGAVGTLGDHISIEQRQWLNSSGKQIIVLPDRVNRGGALVDIAEKEGWYVSFPRWDKGIKDAAEATKNYGKLYTLWSVINTRTKNRLEINTRRNMDLR